MEKNYPTSQSQASLARRTERWFEAQVTVHYKDIPLTYTQGVDLWDMLSNGSYDYRIESVTMRYRVPTVMLEQRHLLNDATRLYPREILLALMVFVFINGAMQQSWLVPTDLW